MDDVVSYEFPNAFFDVDSQLAEHLHEHVDLERRRGVRVQVAQKPCT